MKRLVRGLSLTGLVVGIFGGLALAAGPAAAHPLGNFTVNHFAGLIVQDDRVLVDYVVDHAEIPTLQATPEIDSDSSGNVSAAELSSYAHKQCARATTGLTLSVDGETVPLTVKAAGSTLPAGQAGLSTLRLSCTLSGESALRNSAQVVFTNSIDSDRIGWREITARGDRVTLTGSTVPAASLSGRLQEYPENLLSSPAAVTTARFTARPGGAPASPAELPAGAAPGPGIAEASGAASSQSSDALSDRFTNLVARQDLTLGFGFLAFLIAMLLGSLHAVAPGHGKTVMAAYLVGRRGSLRDALSIGATVTVTHTAGVLALGVALTAFSLTAPERLYSVLGAASGLLLAGMGIVLLAAAVRGHRHRDAHAGHSHGHSHGGHSHGGHSHGHSDGGHSHTEAHAGSHPHPHSHPHADGGAQPQVDRRGLLAIGLANGLVPSPSALVVLLGAIALGRAWFGVVLVLAYGVGMALTLAGAGLLLIRVRHRLELGAANRNSRALRLVAVLPVVTAVAILGLGLALTLRNAGQIVAML